MSTAVAQRAHTGKTLRAAPFALLVLVLAFGCLEPKDRRPGFRLSGEVVTEPVTDWSFSDSFPEIFVETRTWYLVPHSVTTGCAAYNGTIYVASIYFDGGDFPEARLWNRNVVRDPRVRLEIGGKLYPRQAVLVTDASEVQAVFDAFAKKYKLWSDILAKPENERPKVVFLRMDPQAGPDA